MTMTKREIRAIVMKRRGEADAEWIAAKSRTIQERVVALSAFQLARVVCGYIALPREVQTEMIFAKAREAGKKVCVPVYRSEGGSYGLAEWVVGETLVRGHSGVREPAEVRWVELDSVDFMMVPGLAFDLKGGRVGRGKGYYDRILGAMGRGVLMTVGLAFGFQVFESVPVETHDVVLDALVTEDNTTVV